VKISVGLNALMAGFPADGPDDAAGCLLQMIVATLTRSYKEAQTYLGFMPIIPALPGLVLAISPVKVKWWMMTIPHFRGNSC